MSLDITCPKCSAEFDLNMARNDDDWRDLVVMIMALPEVVHRPVWQYLSLFRGKHKVRTLKMIRIVKELTPLIKAAEITRNQNTYRVPAVKFAQAMTYLVDSRPESLVLPLKGNGYLLGMLANQAEKFLNDEELKKDAQLRNKAQTGSEQKPVAVSNAITPEVSERARGEALSILGIKKPVK